jgi:hypothetical protein
VNSAPVRGWHVSAVAAAIARGRLERPRRSTAPIVLDDCDRSIQNTLWWRRVLTCRVFFYNSNGTREHRQATEGQGAEDWEPGGPLLIESALIFSPHRCLYLYLIIGSSAAAQSPCRAVPPQPVLNLNLGCPSLERLRTRGQTLGAGAGAGHCYASLPARARSMGPYLARRAPRCRRAVAQGRLVTSIHCETSSTLSS